MKKIIVVIFILSMSAMSFAQTGFTGVTWGLNMPMDDDMKNFVGDELTTRGLGIDLRYFIKPRISAGISFRWQVMPYETDKLISIRSDQMNGDVSGKQWRYVNAFPILANMHYYLGNRNSFQAFFGLNAGVSYIRERFEIGVFAYEASNWHFTLAPEAGFTYPISRELKAIVNLRYNYAVAAGQSITGQTRGYSYLGIDLGLAFFYW